MKMWSELHSVLFTVFVFLPFTQIIGSAIDYQPIEYFDFENRILEITESQDIKNLSSYIISNIDATYSDSIHYETLESYKGDVWNYLIIQFSQQRDSEEIIRIYKDELLPRLDTIRKYSPYAFYSIQMMSASHYVIYDPDFADEMITSGDSIFADVATELYDTIAHYNLLGKYFYKKDSLKKSESFFLKSISYSERSEIDLEELSTSYSHLGDISKAQKNYTSGINYYLKSVEVLKKLGSGYELDWMVLYNNIGAIFQDLGDYKKANIFYRKSLESLQSLSYETRDLGLSYRNIGTTYAQQGNFQEAIEFLEKAYEVEKRVLGHDNPIRAITLNHLSSAFSRANEISKAEIFALEAYDILKDFHSPKYYHNKLSTILSLSRIQEDKGDFIKSLEYSDLGLKLSEELKMPDYEMKFTYQIGKCHLSLGNSKKAIEAFSSSLDQSKKHPGLFDYVEIGIKSNQRLSDLCVVKYQQWLRCRFEYLIDACDLFISLQETKSYLKSKFELSERYSGLFRETIDVAMEIYQISPTRTNIEILNDLIKKVKYKQINDKTSNRIIDNVVLNKLRLRLAELKDNSQYAQSDEKILDEIVKIQLEIEDLENSFREINNKKSEIRPRFKETQITPLSNDMLELNYFELDSGLVLTYISSDTFGSKFIPVNYKLDLFVNGIISSLKSSQSNISTSDIKTISDALLPQSILKEYQYSSIRISPDTYLHYLPFDILISDDDFLIKNYDISYHITIPREKKEKEIYNKVYFGFAPSYTTFPKLEFAKEEIFKSQEIINGKTYGVLSKSDLIENLKNSRIAHLALHAEMDKEMPFSSKLIIYDQDSLETLSLRQIAGQSAFSELILLSACNSGNGYLYESDGVVSLASAFTMAGAKSIMTSLWNVNDFSSVKINTRFLHYLSEGNTKSRALRLAKLDYINEAKLDELKSPYYWANFILIGGDNPISISNGHLIFDNQRYIILIVVTFIFFLVYILFRRFWAFS